MKNWLTAMTLALAAVVSCAALPAQAKDTPHYRRDLQKVLTNKHKFDRKVALKDQRWTRRHPHATAGQIVKHQKFMAHAAHKDLKMAERATRLKGKAMVRSAHLAAKRAHKH